MCLYYVPYNTYYAVLRAKTFKMTAFIFYLNIVKLMKRTVFIHFLSENLPYYCTVIFANSCKCSLVEKGYSKMTAILIAFCDIFVTLKLGGYTFQTHTVTYSYHRNPLFSVNITKCLYCRMVSSLLMFSLLYCKLFNKM